VKFLCEHCKAKYQIADEKVAGRTVRMKCRKCGNPIEVRAAVTETSVNAKLPTDPPPAHPAGSADASKAPRPGRSLATSLSAAPKPAPARPAAPRSPEGGSLAGAFHRNVQQKEEEISVALDLRELSAADEWYVAINGVPVGPIRVAELRRKAAIGVVGEDSLCWQEGMEEWRPVRAVAELVALVREAAVGGRVSLVTPPPPDARPGFGAPARPGPARPGGAGAPLAPRAPRPGVAPAPNAWSNVVPITSRLATAEKLNEEPARLDAPLPQGMVSADPFASPVAPAPSPFLPASPTATAGADHLSGPLPATPSFLPPAPVEKRPPPFIAIAMIVLAAAFGVTAAIVLLKPAPQVVVQVPAGATAAPQAAPTATATPTAAAAAPTDSAATAPTSSSSAPGKVASASGGRTGGAAIPGKPAAVTDPSLQALIQGAAGGNGPTAGPGGGPGGGAGAELTSDQVQSVLQSHQVGLKRTCWDRVQTQSSTVNETVHIVVGASGQVSSASASGNDPVVGHCIEGEVRRWSFPGSGEINIPFHFLRQ
jgi:predicted Zn finger-like uncharacterized protein